MTGATARKDWSEFMAEGFGVGEREWRDFGVKYGLGSGLNEVFKNIWSRFLVPWRLLFCCASTTACGVLPSLTVDFRLGLLLLSVTVLYACNPS